MFLGKKADFVKVAARRRALVGETSFSGFPMAMPGVIRHDTRRSSRSITAKCAPPPSRKYPTHSLTQCIAGVLSRCVALA